MAAAGQQPCAPSSTRDPGSRRNVLLAGGAIVLAALAAYHNSFHAPFFFDDIPSITNNPSIRHLWPLRDVLMPPPKAGVGGRPFLNLTFAINYALGGTQVWGYHAVNLLIHILAGLTLFGIMRRTLEKVGTGGPPVRSGPQGRTEVADGRAARPYLPIIWAFVIALIWTLHPLNTEAVTYVSQRAESLMGLFYLLTLYCFIRYAASAARARNVWAWLSVGACLFGFATKEIIVTAPVLVLLYDRTFVSGSFARAWREHRRLYLGLAGSWLFFAGLMRNFSERTGTVGFGLGGSWWVYPLTECQVVVRYLKLAVWPHPLILDYGMWAPQATWGLAPYVIIMVLLAAGTVYALFRPGWQAVGFAGAWIFVILAPTSSVVAVAGQPMAEHRMYLPLAAVVALVVVGGYALLERVLRRVGTGGPPVRSEPEGLAEVTDGRAARPYLWAMLALAVGLGVMTAQRNEDYRSELAMWNEGAANWPSSERVQYNLAGVLAGAGRWSEAIAHYQEALRLAPHLVKVRYNLGNAFLNSGRLPEAIATFTEVLRQDPNYAEAHVNLGIALADSGRGPEAIAQDEEALALDPDFFPAHYNLAQALAATGRTAEAISHYEEARRLRPGDARTLGRLGDALADAGRYDEAASRYEEALRLEPDNVKIHGSLGAVLIQLGRNEQAVEQFAAASRLQPDNAEIHNILGAALAQLGRGAEARAQFAEALRLKPGDAEARAGLDQLRAHSPGAN